MAKWQRICVGVIGICCLLYGAGMYFIHGDISVTTSIATRVGALLLVIWLAWPQLEMVKTKIPGFLFLCLLLLLTVLAVRPRLFPLLSGLLAVSLTLSWVLKKLGRPSSN